MTLLRAAILCVLAAIAGAETKSVTLNYKYGSMVLTDKFGFSHTGHVNLSVERVAVESFTTATPDPSRLGFVLLADVAAPEVVLDNPRFCLLDSPYVVRVLTFREFSPVSTSCHVTIPDRYRLFFANCAPPLTAVTMTVHIELYNLNDDGVSREYITAGGSYLPSFFFSLSTAYLFILGFWICFCFCFANKTFVLRIHLAMTGLLVIKALGLVSAFEYTSRAKLTGTPHGWDVTFLVFRATCVVVHLILVLMVKRVFAKKEIVKADLTVVIALQVVASLVTSVTMLRGFSEWWKVVQSTADASACIRVMDPDSWPSPEKSARKKVVGFLWNFYWVSAAYFVFTRILFAVAYEFIDERRMVQNLRVHRQGDVYNLSSMICWRIQPKRLLNNHLTDLRVDRDDDDDYPRRMKKKRRE